MSVACAICGDPEAYPLAIQPGKKWGCPHEPDRTGGVCAQQLARARREAEWRRRYPEAFDAMGNIKEGGLALILERIAEQRGAEALAYFHATNCACTAAERHVPTCPKHGGARKDTP